LTARTSSPRSCRARASAAAAPSGIGINHGAYGGCGIVRIPAETTALLGPASCTTSHQRGIPAAGGDTSPAAALRVHEDRTVASTGSTSSTGAARSGNHAGSEVKVSSTSVARG